MTTSQNNIAWPRHNAICLDCRTAYRVGESCEAGKRHRVVSLTDPRQREALMQRVWGPPTRRRRMKQIAQAGAPVASPAGLLESCGGGCADLGVMNEVGAAIAIVAVLFISGYALLAWIGRLIQIRRHTLKPTGATAKSASIGRPSGMTGIIESTTSTLSPITKTRCVGYAITLDSSPGLFAHRRHMLHDAATIGFDVRLDFLQAEGSPQAENTGKTIRIPRGRLIVNHGNSETHPDDTIGLSNYLKTIDPKGNKSDDLEPFPSDHVQETLLQIGDRVEIRNPVTAIVDPDAHPTDYRDAATTILQPQGTPKIYRFPPNQALQKSPS